MALAVVTVASGGLPVVETTAGLPVSEAANARGLPVTKVVGKAGLPVTYTTVGAGVPLTVTLDAATAAAVTLSGDSLTATSTGTTATNQGARVANSGGKTAGLYYFEATYVVSPANQGDGRAMGVGTTASTFTGIGTNGTAGVVVFRMASNLFANGANTGMTTGGAASVGNVIGVAVNLDTRKAWFKNVTQAGLWNGQAIGSQNPVGGIGGIAVPAGTMVPFVTFGGALGTANQVVTMNFGASAFAGAVPSGFTAGWPV